MHFYGEKKRRELPVLINTFSKPRYREPLNKQQQERLDIFVRQIYNPRIKKLKEAEYFREEWLEPEMVAKT